MAMPGVTLQAYLVVDNCMLVMLQDYFCDRYAARLGAGKLIPALVDWFADQFNTLRQFTPDALLHCTDCVAGEFRPGAGRLSQVRGVGPHDCKALTRKVCDLLHQTSVAPAEISALRGLPAAPRKLVGVGGLSDSDLSLVVLALGLVADGSRVYVLTNDQDLLSFISWLRSQREARERWRNAAAVQGLQSLSYLELVHRDCKIRTEHMEDLINFFMVDHYNRRELAGTIKGNSILQQAIEVRNGLTQSVQIKLAAQGGLA